MNYTLYTTVDITNTGQYRPEIGMELLRWKEQNFQTIVQTLNIRANIHYTKKPSMAEVKGTILGFETNNIIKVWTFEFSTERDHLYEKNGDPIGFLKDDFEGIPYINGLDECMTQNYNVFVTDGPARNIIFYTKD